MKTRIFLLSTFLIFSCVESSPKFTRHNQKHLAPKNLQKDSITWYSISTSAALTSGQIYCLKQQFNDPFQFSTRIYNPEGLVDQVGIQNLKNADVANVDGIAYMAPCADENCKNNITKAAKQVESILNVTGELGMYPFIWAAIHESKWSKDQAKNQRFFEELLSALYSLNEYNGVMSSKNAWVKAFGANYAIPSSITLDAGSGPGVKTLWWVEWNGKQDYSGFSTFGNFKNTSAINGHQYAGGVTTNECATGVPLDYTVYVEE